MTASPFALLLVAAAIAAFVVGFLKTSVGGAIGIVLTPMLSLLLPPQTVLALTAPLLNLSDPVTLRYYWRQWDARQLRLLIPATLVGVALGTWGLSLLSEFWLKKCIGLLAVVFGAIQLLVFARGRRLLGLEPHWGAGTTAGVLTGVASSVAHSGGIVLGLYLVNLNATNATIVATSGAVVAVSNVLKLAGYWRIGFLTGQILLVAVLVTPLLVVGGWLGYRVNRWLPRRWFELALVALAMAGGLRLLTHG